MYEKQQIVQLVRKLRRLEDMLHERMFVKVGEVDMKVYPTKESLYRIPDKALFEPCEKGTRWEEEGLYCWFEGCYQVPESLAGQTLHIYPHIDGYEGLLWVNGKPYGNFASKVIIINHGNHYCNMLTQNAVAGEKIDIALEYYSHHHVRGEDPFDNRSEVYEIQYNNVDICVKDELICNFYYDLHIVNQMMQYLEKDESRRAEVVRTLIQVHRMVDYDIDQADPEQWRNSVQEADKVLQKLLQDKNGSCAPHFGLVGHSHMDTAWLWHMGETVKKCARTYSNQLSLMDQYPEYRFIQSSSQHTYWMEKYYPEIFEGLKQRIAEGRYEPNGGTWIECDCNIPGGEYMVRQFLWGQNYTKSRFNYRGDCFWLPDTFGYSASLPQIMKGCGINYFVTTKLSWNDTTVFPYNTFYWEGIDGSKVLSHCNAGGPAPEPRTFLQTLYGRDLPEATVTDHVLFTYGCGDGGGGPEFEGVEYARRLEDVAGLPRAKHVSVSEFMKEKEAESFRPSVYSGELYLELHRGTLTNQHQIKRNNRLAEIAIRNLEYFTVLDALERKVPVSAEKIHPLTAQLLKNQFHDVLPGTCIPRVHQESREQTGWVIREADKQIHELTQAQETDKFITAHNTLSFDRNDVVYLPLEKVSVKGAYLQQRTETLEGEKVLAVAGAKIPAFAGKVFEISEDNAADKSAFDLQDNVLVTPFYKVTFDERGYISSLIDLEADREVKGAGYNLNTFLVAEDVPIGWDNWDIDADIEEKWLDCAKLLDRKVISDGAVEFRIRSEYQLTAKSSLVQDMVFYSTDRKIAFFTKMNWQEEHRFLKTAFDTSVHAKNAKCEIQFGYIERPTHRSTGIEKAKFEVCNHKYTDLSETRYGAALLNDCKYGISVKGSGMWLSLHKGGTRPDHTGDKGIHSCAYAFVPHNCGFSTEAVVRPAYEFNMQPVVAAGNGERDSFLKVDAPNVIIETVKPMELEDGYVIRLYEAEGTRTKTRLWLKEKGKQILQTNMLEEDGEVLTAEDSIALELRPFEIKTICVKC